MLEQIKEALTAATPGPWKVFETVYEPDKPYLAERQIGTAYDHPQLKGPDSIVTLSHGIGEPRTRVHIDEENAHLIANTPTYIRYLLDELEKANIALYTHESYDRTVSELHEENEKLRTEHTAMKDVIHQALTSLQMEKPMSAESVLEEFVSTLSKEATNE